MSDNPIGTAPGTTPAGQIPVSPNNPCPFLRALVANGYVGGHVVPLSQLSEMIGLASGETGSAQTKVRLETRMVAVIANGLGPLSVLKSATSGAVLDELRDGPLDKHGGGSRILDVDAKVHEDEIARLAGFGKDCKDPAGGVERGLTAKEIDTFMKANLKRDGDAAHWYYPMLMKGEWPVLLKILGKGEGEERYLSVAEVRTLFVERRLPERITARLPKPGLEGCSLPSNPCCVSRTRCSGNAASQSRDLPPRCVDPGSAAHHAASAARYAASGERHPAMTALSIT